MTSGYLKRTCVRVVLFAHLIQIFTPTMSYASDTDYQYLLKIQTLNLESEQYRVEVSRRKMDSPEVDQVEQVVQRLDMEKGRIKDHFIRHAPDGQDVLYGKFSGAAVKTYEGESDIRFVYNIPGFGQIKMMKGDKAFFIQGADDTSLSQYEVSVESTGDLMIANLKVLGLVMQSQNLLLDNVSSSQRLSYVNNGILQLKNSMLNFSSLTNNGTLELYSGQYTVDYFYKSHLLRFLENDWTLSSSHSAASNRFVVLRTLDLVEKIESEKNLVYSKLGDLPKISCQGDIFFPKGYMTHSMACLANIESGGKVTIWCKPDDQLDLDCSNIADLELNLIGACARKHFLKAQTLTLNVDGSLTLGASNEQLGAIAATSGPLTVNAHSIDGRFGKFYGFGTTLLKSTKGDILVGSPLFGVDPEFKEWYVAAQGPLDLTHVVPEEHQYYRELYDRCAFLERSFKSNGAYFSSNAKIIVESAKNIIAEFGVVFGGQGTSLKASERIQNIASKFYSLGLIKIRGLEYEHTAKNPERVSYDSPYSGNCPGMWCEYPTSGPALLSSIGDINFHVQKITSRGSTILTQGNIFVNGVRSVKKDNVEFLPSLNGSPMEILWTNHNYFGNWLTAVLFSLPNIIQSGKNIQIHTCDFTISGSTSTRGLFSIRANQALFYNNSRVRSDRYHTNFNVFDLTQSLNEKAQSGDPLFRLGNNGAIETEFPMGNPSMPEDGQVVLFDDGGLPIQQIPMNLLPIFNPLSGINLDLHVLSAMARLTGKVFLNNTDDDCSAKTLWDNARRWKESTGKELVTFNDLHNIKEAMLMFQIRQVGNMLQKHTLICTPASENNPYKSEGDHVAGSISSVTDGDQQLLNSRLVAQGNIDIKSTEGAVDMQTQSYSEFYVVDGAEITQDYAMPQQQIISMTGSANVSSQHDLTHTGDLMRAVSIKQTSNAGSLKDNPLILKRFVKSEREESRGWSTKRIIETSLTHSALTSTIVVDETLHDKAAVSIDLVAPQYYAGKEILFQAPKTNIKAKLLANRSTSHAVEKGAFTKTETFNSAETPFAEPANINAPVVTFEGKDAVINANISSGKIRDLTDNGIKFVAEVIQLLSSGQTLVDSPLCSVDAGYKAGYETMMPCMLMVEKIIRTKEGGEMLFESVLMDDRAEIIGKFVKTTYELKQWQTSWCHVEQVVPNEIIIAAAIAITILTKGAGTKVMAPLIKGVTAATGMALSPIGITMVNAGFSAFCAAATSNTLRSGDPIQVAKQMVSLDQLKSIGITMASAGLCSQMGGMLDINMEPGIKELSMHLKEQALRGTVDTILNVSINQTPVDEALSDAIKQIPLKAVAAYAANQICWSINEPLGVKAVHTALGGLAGFAMEGNSDGLVAGATGALTAQVVGDILMSDAHAIVETAMKGLNENNIPLTPENLTAAIGQEVANKADLAKIAAVGVTVLLKKNPNTALFAASNMMDNDITIRQSIYVVAELQKLLEAAAMTKAATRIEEPAAMKAKPAKKRAAKKSQRRQEAEDVMNMYLLDETRAKPPTDYQDVIFELASEQIDAERKTSQPKVTMMAAGSDFIYPVTEEITQEDFQIRAQHHAAAARGVWLGAQDAVHGFVELVTHPYDSLIAPVGRVLWDVNVVCAGLNNRAGSHALAHWDQPYSNDYYLDEATYASSKDRLFNVWHGIKEPAQTIYNANSIDQVEAGFRLASGLLTPWAVFKGAGMLPRMFATAEESIALNDFVTRTTNFQLHRPANKNRMPFVDNPAAPNHATANYSHLNIVSPWEDGTMFIDSCFVGPKDTAMQEILETSKAWTRYNQGPYVVAVHGSEQGVALTKMKATTGKNVALDNILNKPTSFALKSEDANWRVLTNLIKKDKIYNPEQMKWVSAFRKDRVTVLFSCYGGGESFAQNLANALGSPVLAPTNILWAFGKPGRFVVAGEKGIGKLSEPNLADFGQFRMYYPGNRPGLVPAPVIPGPGVPSLMGTASPIDALSKRLNAMRNNPKGDWQAADLQYIAERYGIDYRQNSTSHVTFSYPQTKNVIAPSRKPIKPVYIKQFLELLDHVIAQQGKK